jgi:hypothetical protein
MNLDYLYQEIVLNEKMKSLNLKLTFAEFVEFLIKFLYEVILEDKIRHLFLCLLSNIILQSDYNKSFISSNHVTEKLFFLLRIEKNKEIRSIMAETLYEIIKDFAKVNDSNCVILKLIFNTRNLIFG